MSTEHGAFPGGAHAARRRGSRCRALLAAASLSLLAGALLALELGSRLLAPDYLIRTGGPHVFSGSLGWVSRRGVSLTTDGRRLTLNQRGYRGRDLALPRTGGGIRVVVLGDSIAFGLHVADHETFATLLDTRDDRIEVANLSVLGYGPDQELLVLEREGLRLEPDVVVLVFCLANDFAEAMLPVSLYDGRSPKPRFRLAEGRLLLDDAHLRRSALGSLAQGVSDESHLFNRVSSLLPRRPASAVGHWRERSAEALLDEDRALRLTLALVGRMRALCRERGIRFIVVLAPDRFSFRRLPPLAEDFAEALDSLGIEAIDLSARFRSRRLRLTDIALDGTGHLSPHGHRLVSHELEGAILGRSPLRR